MATRDTGQPASGITRRDFLKTAAAATAVAGCAMEFAYDPEKAAAYEDSPDHTVTFTTCPYCSASCGQRVVVEDATQQVVDIYGDFESPINQGGLCAKGAGAKQLVNNPYRIGAWAATDPQLAYNGGNHPVNNVFRADTTAYPNGVAYKRVEGTHGWQAMDLNTALADIAGNATYGLKKIRDDHWTADPTAAGNYNTNSVAFFGSSHINNEPNYLYRKTIAMFGTSNVEHQARI